MTVKLPLPDDDWLRQEPERVRLAWIARQAELGRSLTESELEQIRRDLT